MAPLPVRALPGVGRLPIAAIAMAVLAHPINQQAPHSVLPIDCLARDCLPAGYKLEQELAALGIGTAADLRALPRPQLLQRFGERLGAFLHTACRGQVRLSEGPGAGAGAGAAWPSGVVHCCLAGAGVWASAVGSGPAMLTAAAFVTPHSTTTPPPVCGAGSQPSAGEGPSQGSHSRGFIQELRQLCGCRKGRVGCASAHGRERSSPSKTPHTRPKAA